MSTTDIGDNICRESLFLTTTSPQEKRTGYSENILIVDDDSRQLNSLSELLELEKFSVSACSNAADALDILKTGIIDLLLLDLNMPGMSGIEIMRHIKKASLGTTVIVVSGETTFEAAEQSLRLGAYDYLRKPYSIDGLINSIRNAFKKRFLEYENTSIQQRLLESESLHRFIVNKSPDIVYMLDDNGCFTFVNERMEKILGYSKEEIIGSHYADLIYDDDMDMAKYRFNERRTGSRATTDIELRLKCKDEKRRLKYFESRYKPITINAFGLYSNCDDNERFIGTYGIARDITDKKEKEKIIYFQAYHDALTKLPNRALLKDRLEQSIAHAKRNSHQLAVMFLDLDRFKNVNDTLGHLVGDKLLQEVAARLKDCIRECDTLSRIGGDEFTILLPEIHSQKDSMLVASKIIKEIKKPFNIDGDEIFVSTSVGIAHYPENGECIDTLLKHADIAMYAIKTKGKDGFEFYSDDMHDQMSEHIMLENDLRRALDNNQFEMHYQPQLDAGQKKIVSVEALLRWHHPERGLVMPCEFIPMCEEIGLINPLGDWILEKVCEDLGAWKKAGSPVQKAALNMSARQFECVDIVDKIHKALKKNNLTGDMLELEITENVLMEDIENVVTVLNNISALGVTIAIDDFGTGYSSLQYLQRLPIHTLKIDRTFVDAMEYDQGAMSIVKAVIAMARGLNLEIVSEGVERVRQLELLQSLGCSLMQGFLFGAAMPEDKLLELVKK